MTFLFWAAAIVVFAIAEAATTALVSIWFAVGAALCQQRQHNGQRYGGHHGKHGALSASRPLPTVRRLPSAAAALFCGESRRGISAACVWMGWIGRPARWTALRCQKMHTAK